jgi:hypothetical protein
MTTEDRACHKCGEENPLNSSHYHACGTSLPDQPYTDQKGQAPPWQRAGWTIKLLFLAGLIFVAVLSIIVAVNAHRHRASTYGITEPSSAALRIESRTSDYTIKRVSVQEAEGGTVVQDIHSQIDPGAETVLEIAPGAYLATVSYVESNQVVPFRPEGSLSASFSVSPGKAIVLCLEGGRSSPEALISIPPKLVFK